MRRACHLFLYTLILFILYLSGMSLAASLQRSLTFYPFRASQASLENEANAAGFDPWLDSRGRPIGWTSRSGEPGRPLVILHGNSGYALHRRWLADKVREADPNGRWKIHILEYPGYGARDGSPSEPSLVTAAREALATLPAPAILLGESIGTGVATQTANLEPERVRGLILLTPFDSLLEVARHHYPFLPVRLLLHDRFDSIQALQNFSGPAAFIIAGADEITPAAGGKRLFEAYTGPKRAWILEGAGHNDAAEVLTTQGWQEVLTFIDGRKPET